MYRTITNIDCKYDYRAKDAAVKNKNKGLEKETMLANKFTPLFWEHEDGRCAIVRMIRDKYEELKADCGADSMQKEILCQRAVFVSIQLESMEVHATRTGELNTGVYAQLINTLLGLMKSLGLERKTKKVQCLESYVRKAKNGKRKRRKV